MRYRFRTSFIGLTALLLLGSCGEQKFDNRRLIPDGLSYGDLVYGHSDFDLECNVQVFELEQIFVEKVDELGNVYLNQFLDANLSNPPDSKKALIIYEPWRISKMPSDVDPPYSYSMGDSLRENRIFSVFDCLKDADKKIQNSFFPHNSYGTGVVGYFTFSIPSGYPRGISDLNFLLISSNGFLMVSAYGEAGTVTP